MKNKLVAASLSGLAVILALCGSNRVSAAPATKPAGQPPNFLIIVADDLGFSDIGCYGGEIATPNLDKLAAGGLRFTQFYNTARCWPTRSALLTGYYPQQINMDPPEGRLPPWTRVLPHYLKPQGYRCYHSGKWHLFGAPQVVTDGGFDRSYKLDDHDRYFNPQRHTLDDRLLPPVKRGSGHYCTTAIADHAIDCLKEHAAQHAGKPFFEYLAFTAPHFPLQALPEDIARYRQKYTEGWDTVRQQRWERLKQSGIVNCALSPLATKFTPRYFQPNVLKKLGPGEIEHPVAWDNLTAVQQDFQATKIAIHAAMVDRMDREIGRVLDQVRAMGAFENTVIVFLSDNGADASIIVRGDRNDRSAKPGSAGSFLCLGPGWASASNAPFRLHKIWNYEGGISTPLIVHWPQGIAQRGALRHDVGHVIDLVPTLLELSGATATGKWHGAEPPPLPGQSFLPTLGGDQAVSRELFFKHEGNRALRSGNRKLVSARENANSWELYDLKADRAEQIDLASRQPELAHRMADRWKQLDTQFHRDATASPSPRQAVEPTPAKAARLQKPNVVLIVSDDQGWTDFGFMKHPHIKTPRLDELAARGALFPNSYTAAPLCRPSLTSILTGMYPHQHGICCNDPLGTEQIRNLVPNDFQQTKQLPALPRLLKDLGYRSLQTGKYWEQHHSTAGFTDGMSVGGRHGDKGLAIGRETMKPIYDFIADCDTKQQPFFVWYAPMLPHDPHYPPARITQKYRDQKLPGAEARYYGMCEWFDETCGELLDYLDKNQLRDNTLVMFVVDNGVSQGYLASRTGGGNGLKARGKGSPYEGGVRTPMILYWPGHTKAGRYDDLVSNLDVASTIMSACGGQAGPQAQGLNLLEVAAGKGRLARKAVFGEAFVHTAVDMNHPAGNLYARWVREGDWKLIAGKPPTGPATKVLFNLAQDPFETKDLAATEPKRVEQLQELLDQWWKP